MRSALGDALRKSRGALAGIGLFSGVINLLMLTGPLFMLQVYDRVLPSGSPRDPCPEPLRIPGSSGYDPRPRPEAYWQRDR